MDKFVVVTVKRKRSQQGETDGTSTPSQPTTSTLQDRTSRTRHNS